MGLVDVYKFEKPLPKLLAGMKIVLCDPKQFLSHRPGMRSQAKSV